MRFMFSWVTEVYNGSYTVTKLGSSKEAQQNRSGGKMFGTATPAFPAFVEDVTCLTEFSAWGLGPANLESKLWGLSLKPSSQAVECVHAHCPQSTGSGSGNGTSRCALQAFGHCNAHHEHHGVFLSKAARRRCRPQRFRGPLDPENLPPPLSTGFDTNSFAAFTATCYLHSVCLVSRVLNGVARDGEDPHVRAPVLPQQN